MLELQSHIKLPCKISLTLIMKSVKKCTEKKQTYHFTTHLKNKALWRFLPDTSPSKINAYKEEDA